MNKTIKERAREAVGRAFTIMDLPPDVERLIYKAIANEFGDEKAYNPKTHICISNNAAEKCIDFIDYYKGGQLVDEINACLNED